MGTTKAAVLKTPMHANLHFTEIVSDFRRLLSIIGEQRCSVSLESNEYSDVLLEFVE